MICTPFPLCTMPLAPVARSTLSSTRDGSLTLQRSLVAQQSTSEMFALPPRPLVIAALFLSVSFSGFAPELSAPAFPSASPAPAAAVSAFFRSLTSALVYNFISPSSSSLPGVLKSNFRIRNRKIRNIGRNTQYRPVLPAASLSFHCPAKYRTKRSQATRRKRSVRPPHSAYVRSYRPILPE